MLFCVCSSISPSHTDVGAILYPGILVYIVVSSMGLILCSNVENTRDCGVYVYVFEENSNNKQYF